MALSSGCHHIAIVTQDLDRLIAFYADIFGADVLFDQQEEGLRHAMIGLGESFGLHVFQFAGPHPVAAGDPDMFGRGHIDHLAINISDDKIFEAIRAKLVACGSSDGELTDFGMTRVVAFTDPDGMYGEIAIWADAPALTLEEAGREAFVPVA